ncbi:hypothetical protein I553_10737 [Mycobacterium xenopi 4042]|uniref:Uncharacterized protein n=1 Tax=Mycobacterium xenopi 4042 TaxID=1299334 RepID=X8DD70_MYCXE|nr:hypothetical protein I553_10737 [Mycobacterium xenopi 4042]
MVHLRYRPRPKLSGHITKATPTQATPPQLAHQSQVKTATIYDLT